MTRIFIPVALILFTACGSGGSKSDDTSGDAAGAGSSCSLGADCTLSEFCFFDFQDGNDPDEGSCVALPEECEGPTSCNDCPELQGAVCAESTATACSDTNADANPIFSCN